MLEHGGRLRRAAQQYAIRSIPTLILFHQGRELARQSGAIGTQDILKWVKAQLQP